MTITFDIPDEQITCIEQFLRTQMIAKVDEITRAQVFEPVYKDAEDYIQRMLSQIISGILQQYPTPAMRAKLLESKRIMDEIAAEATPMKISRVSVPAA